MNDKSNNPFNILNEQSSPINTGKQTVESDKSADLTTRIKNLIHSSDVFLFMKGSPDMPQCGFSANVVAMLNHLQIQFQTFDILSDMDIRQGVKEFSNWPTYPQLYFKGQLIGGNDILTEMFESGELQKALS